MNEGTPLDFDDTDQGSALDFEATTPGIALDFDEPREHTTPSIGDKINERKATFMDRVYRDAQSFSTGLLQFGSSLAKRAAEIGQAIDKSSPLLAKYFPSSSPEDIQNYYESMKKESSSNPYPEGKAFEIGGALLPGIATLPGGTAIKGAETLKGLGTVGKIAGSTIGGAVEGALYGGLLTEPGQGSEAMNTKGIKEGAMLGGILGPLQSGISGYLKQANKYEDLSRSLPKGSTTPIMNTDMLDDDIVSSFRKMGANKILDNIPIIGRKGAREEQITGFKKDLETYLNTLSSKTVGQSFQSIASNLNNTATSLAKERQNLWNDTFQSIKQSGITDIVFPKTSQHVEKIISQYDEIIPKTTTKLFNEMQTNIKPERVPQLLDQIWDSRKALVKGSVDQRALARSLKQLYGTMSNEFKNSFEKQPWIADKIGTANAFSSAYKSMFDPQSKTMLSKAIQDLNESQQGLQKMITWLTGSEKAAMTKPTSRNMQKYLGVLGEQGMKDLEKIKMTEIFKNSLSADGNFNVSSYINQINKIRGTASEYVVAPSLKALEGLETVMKQHITSKAEGKLGMVGSGLLMMAAGAPATYGAMTNPMATGAVLLGLKAGSWISAHSPIKNALMSVNSITNNPKMMQYLINKINNEFTKAGITISSNEDGDMTINKRNSENK